MVSHILTRFRNSLIYCRDAFVLMVKKEESFRIELAVLALLLFVLALVRWSGYKKVAMIATYLLVPMMEVVNTAIEDVCNLHTREPNAIVKHAKDKGALSVLFAIVVNVLVLIMLAVV